MTEPVPDQDLLPLPLPAGPDVAGPAGLVLPESVEPTADPVPVVSVTVGKDREGREVTPLLCLSRPDLNKLLSLINPSFDVIFDSLEIRKLNNTQVLRFQSI